MRGWRSDDGVGGCREEGWGGIGSEMVRGWEVARFDTRFCLECGFGVAWRSGIVVLRVMALGLGFLMYAVFYRIY